MIDNELRNKTPSNVFSIDSLIERRRGKNYLTNMIMSTQKSSSIKVATMLIWTDRAKSYEEGAKRYLVLCEEDSTSRIMQTYSGAEKDGARRDICIYKGTTFDIDHPKIDAKFMGTVDEFLGANVDLADAVAAHALVLEDQLMLCRAVYEMRMTGCNAKTAFSHAQEVNALMVDTGRQTSSSAQKFMQSNIQK